MTNWKRIAEITNKRQADKEKVLEKEYADYSSSAWWNPVFVSDEL